MPWVYEKLINVVLNVYCAIIKMFSEKDLGLLKSCIWYTQHTNKIMCLIYDISMNSTFDFNK